MLQFAFIASAVAAVSGPGYLGTSYQRPHTIGGSLLATMPTEVNGRLWISRPIIGGMADAPRLGWGDPGPAAYGAAEDDFSQAYARTNTIVQSIYPWIQIPAGGLNHLEQARVEWLKQNGYVGGVRTFVNDTVMLRGAHASARREILPRATIQLPADMPSFRHRQQVMQMQPGDRMSLPHNAPRALLARVNKTDAAKLASR
jgi:hypothetical protein